MSRQRIRLLVVVIAALAIGLLLQFAFQGSDRDRARHENAPDGQAPAAGASAPEQNAEPSGSAASEPGSASSENSTPERSDVHSLRGIVLGPLGMDPTTVSVDVRPLPVTGGIRVSAPVASDGSFSVELNPTLFAGNLLVSAWSRDRALVSHPVWAAASTPGGRIDPVMLLMVPGGTIRLRVIDNEGNPVPVAEVSISEVAQTSYRGGFAAWESGAYVVRDQFHLAGEDARVSCPVRSGHVRIRVRTDGDAAWSVEHEFRVVDGQVQDCGDLVAPADRTRVSIRVRNASGPIPATIRLDERALRLGHALQEDDVHHFRVAAGEAVELVVCAGEFPISGAAISPGYYAAPFELVSPQQASVSIELKPKPSRVIRVVGPEGRVFSGAIRWSAIPTVGAKPSRNVRKGHPIEVFDVVVPMTNVLAMDQPGHYRLVSGEEHDVDVEGTILGGFRIVDSVTTEEHPDWVNDIGIAALENVDLLFARAAGAPASTFFYSWTVRGEGTAGTSPVEFELRARLGEPVGDIWIPAGMTQLRCEESSGVFVAQTLTRPASKKRLRGDVELSETASRIELIPILDGTPLGAAGIHILISGVGAPVASFTRVVSTDESGVARGIVPAGEYSARLYPIVGPTSPTRFTTSRRSVTAVNLPLRAARAVRGSDGR